METEGLAEAIDRLVVLARASDSRIIRDDETGTRYMIHPNGHILKEMPPVNPILPDHIVQVVTFADAESFARYVIDFRTGQSRLFANVETAVVVVDLDYHTGNTGIGGTDPAHRSHRAVWNMPLSEQWRRWAAIDGKLIPQREFAEFIEENLPDIASPPGAELLEMVQSLSGTKKVTFENGVRNSNGSTQLQWIEETEAKGRGNMTVPGEIALGIPIFFGGDVYRIRVLFRYRIVEGKLLFRIDVHRKALVLRGAVMDEVKKVAGTLDMPPLYGVTG